MQVYVVLVTFSGLSDKAIKELHLLVIAVIFKCRISASLNLAIGTWYDSAIASYVSGLLL